MPRGIIINGASGTGKTTLGLELAKRLDFFFMDLDDYYRNKDTGISCSNEDEIRKNIVEDIARHPNFVMSGSIIGELLTEVRPYIDYVVLLFASTETRVNRVKARTAAEYGNRIMPGGDMYDIAELFYKDVKRSNPKKFELWSSSFICPVIRLDGEKSIETNASVAMKAIFEEKNNSN